MSILSKLVVASCLCAATLSYAATENYHFTNEDGTIQMTMSQSSDATTKGTSQYISNVKLTNTNDNCTVDLTFNSKEANCRAYGVNFCGYDIEQSDYSLGGIVGASYSPLYQTGIQLDGTITQNGCTIKSFDYQNLFMTSSKNNLQYKK